VHAQVSATQAVPCGKAGCTLVFRGDPGPCEVEALEASGKSQPSYTQTQQVETHLPLSLTISGEGGRSVGVVKPPDQGNYEHIAAPECDNPWGYASPRISPDEMYGCTTMQSLLMKPEGWEHSSDDMDFERDTKHFLTGLCSGAPLFGHSPPFRPTRHGVHESPVVDSLWRLEVQDINLRFI
jgi:hypothetical protein